MHLIYGYQIASTSYPRKLPQRIFKRPKMPLNNGRENVLHGFLIKRLNTNNIEMSEEPRRHIVPATPWWSHGWHHHNIYQLQYTGVLPVEPVPLINPLTKDLYGGLGPVLLFGWHVQVIHKHHHFLPQCGAKHTLLPPEIYKSVQNQILWNQ